MSTRSVIVLKTGEAKLYVYRHCDGYLSENGNDLARILAEVENEPGDCRANALLAKLLSERYEATSFRGPTPVYRLIDGLPGDIECYYEVAYQYDKVSNDRKLVIKYAGYDNGNKGYGDELVSKAVAYSLAEFQGLVKMEVADAEKRYSAYLAKQAAQ